MLESFNWKWLLLNDLLLAALFFKWTFDALNTIRWYKFFKLDFIQIILSWVTVAAATR